METWQLVTIILASSCFLCCILPCLCCCCSNARWKTVTREKFNDCVKLCETKLGTVEYTIREPIGEKSGYVLVCQGTPGFHDGCSNMFHVFSDVGLGVIVPSRPNFGRTKLKDWKSPTDAAAGFVALMEELKIDSYAVYGISGGGPTACTLAMNYPDKVKCLVLDSAITGGFKPEGTDEV